MRNNVFDNVKFLMILLVVFGHLIEPLINSFEAVRIIYMFIYSFHMPIFIILAGALTKLDVSESRLLKNIKSLLIPLLIFTVLYEVFNLVGGKGVSHYTLNWKPYWILWFLFSMFIWKMALPVIMQFKHPLLLSICISLCAGYINDVGYFLGVSRTIYFFPLFILGYKLGPAILSNNILAKVPRVCYAAVLLINIIIFWLYKDLPAGALYGSMSYDKLGDAEWYSFVIRLLLYIISFISSIAILMLTPNWSSALTQRGQNSLFVYVWHGFFVKVIIYFGLINTLSSTSSAIALTSLLVIAILITILLSSKFIANLTTKLLLLPCQNLFLKKTS